MDRPINILVIEDSIADFKIVERHLNQQFLSVLCHRVDSLEGLRDAIDREKWDLVLIDYNVPQLNFQEGLDLVGAALPRVPIIMVTGAVGEERAVDFLKLGIWDFVLKDNLTRLVPAIQRSLKEKKGLEEQRHAEKLYRKSQAMYRSLFENMLNGFAYCRMIFEGNTPIDYTYLSVNEAFERQTGLKNVIGKRVSEVIPNIRETDNGLLEIYGRVASTGNPEQFEIYINALKQWFWVSVYCPAKEHFVAVFDVITERKRAEELIQIRMRLMEYSKEHTLEELLRNTLDEVGRLLDSPIGFYHFVESDQKTLSLQTWSTSTLERFCKAEGKGLHYSIDKAGVWVDCVRQRKPVVHNDYVSLPHRKGLPEGHAAVYRELVVPIIREEQIVAILGVGNKPQKYTEQDVIRVSYLADVAWEIVESMRAKQSLIDSMTQFHRLSEEYQTLLDNLPDGVVRVDPDHRIIWTNRSMKKMIQADNGQLPGTCCYSAFWNQTVPCVSCPVAKAILTGTLVEENITTPDGRLLELRAVPIFAETGKVESVIEVMRDVTEHRKLEAQYLQAQKMESVGRLAGGVAHDYNNMLSVIVGYSELLLSKFDSTDEIYEDLGEIHKAGVRSTEITRQLLTFARKQTIAPVVLNLNDAVDGMLNMLKRLIGEAINLAWLPGTDALQVKLDPSQLDQLLVNLCVNARDAIDGVGKITIQTDKAIFDEVYCADHTGFVPGEYVVLMVSDDGCGMDHETVDKIFEPFFTTKAAGRGTGLGLSTVYGIVKQNKGFIYVYSEPGEGTTFKIYLTCHADLTLEAPKENPADISVGHGEIILIVEDEVSILILAKKILEPLGYTVLTAEKPSDAMRLLEEHRNNIDLLITDVVMPEMNGKELSSKMCEKSPNLKTIFMSGYTADAIAHHGVLNAGVNFIQKPFSQKSLAAKVKEVLLD